MNGLLISAAITYTGAKWIAVGITIVVLLIAVGLVGASAPPQAATGRKGTSRFLRILLGADGRVSTSRTVALAWTAVVIYILLALIISNPEQLVRRAEESESDVPAAAGVPLRLAGAG